MRKLSDCYLYGILDLAYVERTKITDVARKLIDGGVDLLQLRGKSASLDELTVLASRLHSLTSAADVPLVVNDYAEIARRVEIEGVHVGQDDESIRSVREQVDRPLWVGKSTHSMDQAVAAEGEGADYIGFGPIYATPTKPDYIPIGTTLIAKTHQEVTIPIFCIGGIKRENLPEVIAAGAIRVVMVSGLLQADDVCRYATSCKQQLALHRSQVTIH